MVFLAITPRGLKDALREAENSAATVWCEADAISEEDFAARKGKGQTRFKYELGARDPLVLEGALDIIDQHHPDEVVWVEAAAKSGPWPSWPLHRKHQRLRESECASSRYSSQSRLWPGSCPAHGPSMPRRPAIRRSTGKTFR